MQHNYVLRLEVQNGEIIVTLPNSIYSVTYFKSRSEHLATKMLPVSYDPNAVLTSDEFLSRKLGGSPMTKRGSWAGSRKPR